MFDSYGCCYDSSQDRIEVTLFSGDKGGNSERLWSQTKLLFGLGLGAAGALYLMPESVTNWDKSELGKGNMARNWRDNVKQGPVWDNDHWAINYIGHPYFGGVYYQVARKSGYDQFNSFLYSALMSTFYWEYGIEAFAEVPSIQDLIVTPIGGWLYGEWAHHQELKIIEGGGKVFGSALAGNISLFFLDPVDSIAKGMNAISGSEIVNASVYFRTSSHVRMPAAVRDDDKFLGAVIHFRY
ncbi:DUF3943 domain-containing protein [Agarivorans sp. B2Z047]|nr:DUF3943 domain-containing protein [Agarivorans sp. B2Z047]